MSKKIKPLEKAEAIAQLEGLAQQLVKALHYGHRFAKTRSELCRELHTNDRALRKMVEIARKKGAMICNDGDGCGYYLAMDDCEIVSQYRREKDRMVNHWNAMKPFYEAMKERGLPT